MFSTSGLQQYKDTFKADGVATLSAEWKSSAGKTYTSIFVHVCLLDISNNIPCITPAGRDVHVDLRPRVA